MKRANNGREFSQSPKPIKEKFACSEENNIANNNSKRESNSPQLPEFDSENNFVKISNNIEMSSPLHEKDDPTPICTDDPLLGPNDEKLRQLQYPHVEWKMDVEEKIAIIDFGAQYGKLIDRRIRECCVYCELLPYTITAKEILDRGFKGIVISGGPRSVYDDFAPVYDSEIFHCGLPILGICYGFQLINKEFGGFVRAEKIREDGQVIIQIDSESLLFQGLLSDQEVLLTHGDSVVEDVVAENFQIIANSKALIAGISNAEKKIYGVQFHPEVDLTTYGVKMLENFLKKICGFQCKYTIENREEICIKKIRETVGDKSVLVMVSGGVDSTVCAALLHRALGSERVHAIHIDNGFMRLNESKKVLTSLNNIGLNVKSFDFSTDFLNGRVLIDGEMTPPLKNTTHPEHKRKIIGDVFMESKDKAIKALNLSTDLFLAQGTLRPDLIESASELASGSAHTIKTHHNDTYLVRELRKQGKVIEPLQDFHKDEVRELGVALGLPQDIVHRHPFPGPGLAIRILCAREPFEDEIFGDTQNLLQQYVTEFNEKIHCSLLPIQSVGVQGDARTYSYVAALSVDVCEESIITKPGLIPWKLLEQIAKFIPTQLHNINRVVYVFGRAIREELREITPTYVNQGTLNTLRHVDDIAYKVMCGRNPDGSPHPTLKNVIQKVQQMPVVMVPLHFDRHYKSPCYFPSMSHSFCLRPFITRDFMTGRAALPGRDIPEETVLEMAKRIQEYSPLISRVMIDLTSKPPGTTEWE